MQAMTMGCMRIISVMNEIKVILINHGDGPFTLQRGDRIAQLIVAPVLRVEWRRVDELDDTSRGAGGFGHTGK